MKYFSMFSGIGGFELGIQRAFGSTQRQGQPTETSTGATQGQSEQLPEQRVQGLACVGYSEIDKYAIKVYERHFRHTNYGNATTINATELPDFDLLVGGFPCQAFSIAGKRKGFDDTRGTLFFDIARILAEKRPRHLVLENVKGLLSHDSGKTFQTILGVLSDLGYRVEWQVLNSKDFGVPQNRERIYLVGHLRGECSGEVLPITNHSGKNLKQLIGGSQGNRVYDTDGISSTLASQAGGLGAKTGLYAINERRESQIVVPRNHRSTFETQDISSTLTSSFRGMPDGDGRPAVYEGLRIRRLTPLECERLQGFPDNWTEGESDTQRYKMCGNAVTVNVVEAVMTNLIKHLEEQSGRN